MSTIPLYPLSHAQKRIMYTEGLYPGTSISNLAGGIEFEQGVNEEFITLAVNHIIAQNDALRIRLAAQQGDEHQQYIVPHTEQAIEILDFSHSPELLRRWEEEQTRKPFDLYDSPLFYFAFLRKGDQKGRLYSKFHHVIVDGISMNLLGYK